jgi:hypothetical protein
MTTLSLLATSIYWSLSIIFFFLWLWENPQKER